MRYSYKGFIRDSSGIVLPSALISVYLAGTSTAANIYAASTGGSSVNSVTADSIGYFIFWVDEASYSNTQLFKIIATLSGRTSVTIDNISIYSLFGRWGVAGGTVDDITVALSSPVSSWTNGLRFLARASGANTSTTPTVNPDGLGAKTIVKGSNAALLAGDIPGAGYWMEFVYDSTLNKCVLQNPSNAITLVGHNTDGTHKNQFGAKTPTYTGTAYQAATDMFVSAGGDSATGGAMDLVIYTDASNPPTTIGVRDARPAITGAIHTYDVKCLVRKGEWYKIVVTGLNANARYFYIPIFN